jgi:hypothetical protein
MSPIHDRGARMGRGERPVPTTGSAGGDGPPRAQALVGEIQSQLATIEPARTTVAAELREELCAGVVARAEAEVSGGDGPRDGPGDGPGVLTADEAGAVAFSVLRAASDLAEPSPTTELAERRRVALAREEELTRLRAELRTRREATRPIGAMSVRELMGELGRRSRLGRRTGR